MEKQAGKIVVDIFPTTGSYKDQIQQRAINFEIFNPQAAKLRLIKYKNKVLNQLDKLDGKSGWIFDEKMGKSLFFYLLNPYENAEILRSNNS